MQPRDQADLSKSNCEHTDLHKTRLIARDEADMKSLICFARKQLVWVKPFSTE